MEHDFEFLGGSLGCAEGQKIAAGFEFATQYGFPVVIECRSGGARMQGKHTIHILTTHALQKKQT